MRRREIGDVSGLARKEQPIIDRPRQYVAGIGVIWERMTVGTAYPIGTTPRSRGQWPQMPSYAATQQGRQLFNRESERIQQPRTLNDQGTCASEEALDNRSAERTDIVAASFGVAGIAEKMGLGLEAMVPVQFEE